MDRLAELREKRGLTLRELSRMSGVSPDTINQIELGHRRPRPSTLRKLARALDIDIEDFFEPEELTARPKAEAVSLEQWLEERCGHSHLARSFEELAQFIEDAEDLDEQIERRQRLRKEIDVVVAERIKFPATEPRNIAGIPFDEIHTRWIRTLFVAVELRRVSPEEATRATREVQKLVLA